MRILQAQITKPARQVTTKYGDRIVADLAIPGGAVEPLWCRADQGRHLLGLPIGAAVTVGLHATGKLSLVEQEQAAAPPPHLVTTRDQAPQMGFQAAPPSPRLDAADAISQEAGEYALCYLALQQELGNILPPEALVSAASTVYIQRKAQQ